MPPSAITGIPCFAATSAQSNAYSFADLRPHIVSVGNNGTLKPGEKLPTESVIMELHGVSRTVKAPVSSPGHPVGRA